ncbi:MAG: UvrD-helicase domain-containing protein [Acidobacteriota bacterium]
MKEWQSRKKDVADSEARERATKDMDHSYHIEAGAGTGKTTILLERVQNILLQEKARLSEIVVITFTEKAAAELKIRLRNDLERLYRDPDEKKSRLVQHALEDYEKSNISTIHSFAASMLRERPVEAGVDPGFEVADEITSSLLFDEIWDEWLEAEMKKAPGRGCGKETEKFPVALWRALSFDVTLKQVKEIAEWIIINRDIYSGRPEKARASAEDLLKGWRPYLDEMKVLADRSCTNRNDRGYGQIIDLCRNLEQLSGTDDDGAKRGICSIKIDKRSGSAGNWNPPEALGKVKQIFSGMVKQLKTFRQEVAQDVCAELADWMDGFIRYYDEGKKKRGYLDFEDLLIRARDMLKHDPAVRRYFQEKFRYILVDEFQDTDPLQAEIIFFLCEEGLSAMKWEDVKVKRGKLFLVGDPKQSIYRFRRADIEIYSLAKRLLLDDGREEKIVVNFRAVPSIIHWVNATFEDLIQKDESHDYQAEYIPIQPHRTQDGIESRVILLYPSQEDGKEMVGMGIEGVRAIESRYIASLIKHAVEEAEWKVRFSDFAILFRKTTGIDTYEQALRAFDVPYRVVGGKHFFMKQEIMGLLAVMKAIDNPADETSIVSSLRSEFFGHSDEEIFLFRESGGEFNYTMQAKLGSDEKSGIHESLELLRDLHEMKNSREISRSLMTLFQKTKALELFYLKPQGEQRVANLLKVVSMARRHENIDLSSFKNFAAWLENMLVEEREAEESPVAEDDDDAVRLMTVHKAKGLEFPVVILASLESGTRKNDRFIVDRRKRRFEFKLGSLEPESFLAFRAEEELREEAEERRIFYVAATRARDKLILPIFPGKWNQGFMRYLAERIPKSKSEISGDVETNEKVSFFDESVLKKEMAGSKPFRIGFRQESLVKDFSSILEKRKRLLQRISGLKKSATGGMRLVSATSIREEVMHDSEAGSVKRSGRGIEIGRLVHSILSQIELRASGETGRDKRADKKMLEALYPGMADEIFFFLEKALETRTMKEAAASRNVMREVPFSICIGSVILEGSIDLLFERDGKFIAADYKTDMVSSIGDIAKRMEEYGMQACIYAYALSRIEKIKLKEIRFLFLHAAHEEEIIVTPDIIERGRSLVMNENLSFSFET